jgi:opacity protein-like surface antigen
LLNDRALYRAAASRKVEAMVSVRLFTCTTAAALVSTAALAADMPQPLPAYQAPLVVVAQPEGAWYLRGDVGIGITNQFDITYEPSPPDVGNGFSFDQHSWADTAFFDVGAGYEWNNWLRFDFTAGYRDRTQVNARGIYNPITGQGDSYQGYMRSWVFLANAYVDLGTWNCLTPFIGAGVGVAFNTFNDLVDTGIAESGSGMGHNPTHANVAWALHAGLSYAVTQNFTMELAYRYLNYGSVTDSINCIGGCNPDSYKVDNLSSNDIMLGFRWRFTPVTGIVLPPPAAISTRG